MRRGSSRLTLLLLHAACTAGLSLNLGVGSKIPRSLLSLPYKELLELAGSQPAAKYLWRTLRNGEDPTVGWLADDGASGAHHDASGFGLGARRREAIATSSRAIDSIGRLVFQSVAADGTRKLLIGLHDGLEVESVIIPPLSRSEESAVASNARAHSTLCISSQVGCRMGCAFCATGRQGLTRNLSTDEILAQAWLAKATVAAAGMPPLTNVVFMGMGEPADNAANVRAAVSVLTNPRQFGFSPKNVLVSTVAPTPAAFASLVGFNEEDATPNGANDGEAALAWSLHAVDESLRKRLVPTARFSPTELRDGLCAALLARPDPRRRRLVVEYVLINGVNGTRHAAAMSTRKLSCRCAVACRAPPWRCLVRPYGAGPATHDLLQFLAHQSRSAADPFGATRARTDNWPPHVRRQRRRRACTRRVFGTAGRGVS